jgi:hypothetical protein
MSKYRYWWRPNVERLLKVYPYLKAREREGHAQAVTPAYSIVPGGGGARRTTEDAALKRPLNAREEEAVRAIDRAMEEIAKCRDGDVVLQIIQMVDFKRTHTIEGAATALYMHRNRAADKRTRFINLVGKYLGWL